MIDNNALPCCGWMWNQFTVYSNRKLKFSFSVSDKFADKNWRVHPDWVYCEYNYAGSPQREFATPEDNIRHFVSRSQTRGWNWGTPSVIPLPKCTNKEQYDPNCFKCKLSLFSKFCIFTSFRVYMFFQLFGQRVQFFTNQLMIQVDSLFSKLSFDIPFKTYSFPDCFASL